MTIATINPATGELVREFAAHTPAEVEGILAKADAANAVMAKTTFAQRAEWMRRAADLLDADLEHAAGLAVLEMGKTIGTATYEVTKSANGMRWYAEHAEGYLAPEEPVPAASVGASAASVVFQPLGTVLAVMPWNYPFWQVIRFAAPPSWPATPGSSSMRRACRRPRCTWASCSSARASRRARSRRC